MGESFVLMRRSYIKSLTISRGPAGTVNAAERISHDVESRDSTGYRPVLRGDVAKSVTIPT
jgi:hypothetical protein